ncbi:MAG: phytoene/squalene synthase family protein [Phycisphaerales bacterium]|jgi:phytoene synthase
MNANAASDHPTPAEQVYGSVDPVEILRRCGRTFYSASLVLPRRVRQDLALLYALCRAIDDSADAVDGSEDHTPEALLDEIASGLRGAHDRSPVVNAFRSLSDQYHIPLVLPQQLIEGVRCDLGTVRVQTEDELLRYSYRVASTVGLMMCRILGVDPRGDSFAVDLGIAMQLTNIARDVAEDARTDRVYVPAEWVDAERVLATVQHTEPGVGEHAGEVCLAVQRLLDTAETYYESAELGMHFLPIAVRGGIRSAAWNYRAIGGVVRRDYERALRQRSRTSGAGKALRTMAALWASSLESLPLGPSDTHDESLHGAVRALRVASA